MARNIFGQYCSDHGTMGINEFFRFAILFGNVLKLGQMHDSSERLIDGPEMTSHSGTSGSSTQESWNKNKKMKQ